MQPTISLSSLSWERYGSALAALLAVFLVSSLHIGNFIFEGDAHVVILALQQPAIFGVSLRLFRIFSILFQQPSFKKLKKLIEVQTFTLIYVIN